MSLVTVIALSALCAMSLAAGTEAGKPVIADNPGPDSLPSLSVHKVELTPGRIMTFVRVKSPDIPEFECEVWCYESPYEPGDAEASEDGSITLRQKSTNSDYVAVTRVVPEKGAVRFDVTVDIADPAQARQISRVNPCWQLTRASGFCSGKDPFPEFVARCFVFTEKGCVTMGETKRFPDTRRPNDDPRNNPPWVQVYLPVWVKHPGQPKAFWGNSTDQYLYPLTGCFSRDGKHLVAMGTGPNRSLAQGWHDCLHPQPMWRPYDAEKRQIGASFKLYMMKNDPEALLKKYLQDFPESARAE